MSRVSSMLSVVCVTAATRSGSGSWIFSASSTLPTSTTLPRRDAERAFHFLMTGVPDQYHGAIFVGIALDLEMDLGHQRAGRIDHAQAAIFGAIPFARRDAMSAENHALAFGHLIEGFDENRAFLFEGLEHEAVVHYLMAHI